MIRGCWSFTFNFCSK